MNFIDSINEKNRALVLTALSLLTFVVSMDMMSVNLILPAVAQNFHANLIDLQWIMTAYTLVSAIFTMIAGKLGDMIGQRKIILLGIATFCMSSLFAGMSYCTNILIVSRALQGLGYAFIIALSNVIISFIYPKEKIGTALGILAGMGALAAAVGPVLVGLIIEFFSWRWVFFINIPVCSYAIFLFIRCCPEIPKVANEKQFDYFGAFFMALGLFLLLIALNQGSIWRLGSPTFVLTIIVGFISVLIFVVIEKFNRSPLLPLAIFSNVTFLAVNLVRMIVSFVMFSLLFGVVFYLEIIFDYTPTQTGLLFLLISLAMIFSAVSSGKLIDRVGPYQPLILSCFVLMLFYSYFSFYEFKTFGIVECILYFIAGFAFGILRPGLGYIIIRITPKEYMGISNAISSTVLPIGGMLGVAISGWLLVSQSTYYLNYLLEVNHLKVAAPFMPLLQKMAQGVYKTTLLDNRVPPKMAIQLATFAKQAFLYAYSQLMLLSAALFLISLILLFYVSKRLNRVALASNPIVFNPDIAI